MGNPQNSFKLQASSCKLQKKRRKQPKKAVS